MSPGETQEVELRLERWIDMPGRGWYSADDHLHITRRTADDDRRIARWTLPLWFYVSVTGVVIYLLLYHVYPAT